jgi:pimeloyl-ACP methyl ester carboxylesterase
MSAERLTADPSSPPPQWWVTAMSNRPEPGSTDVGGVRVAYRTWGAPGRPGIVLVHGGAAHSGWWDHIAPLLGDDLRVVALDLSGHGDSDRRSAYSLSEWASEVVAVTEAAGIDGLPVVVGHSMGGWVSTAVAVEHPEVLTGLVVIDSPAAATTPEEEAARARVAFGPLRVYPTLDDAMARYHTVPDQPGSLPYVLAHVASQSVRAVEGGYTWKFDPTIFVRSRADNTLLGQVSVRSALFRSEHGLIPPDIGLRMYDWLGQVAPVIEIPAAGHHPMLDQPLSLITGLRTLLADWRHSAPYRRSE